MVWKILEKGMPLEEEITGRSLLRVILFLQGRCSRSVYPRSRLLNQHTQKISVGSACKDRTDHQDGMHLPETFNGSDETNRVNPGIGQSSGSFEVDEVANGIPTIAFGINDKDLNRVMENHSSRDNCKRFGRLKGYRHYVVRPRKISRSGSGVADNLETSYFCGVNCGSEGPIIAEWNEREKRAEYALCINDGALSGSYDSDSTYSDEYDYKAAPENLADSMQSKLEIVDSDQEDSDPS